MSDFVCDNCDKTFTTKQSMMYHVRQEVCKKDNGNACKFCGKQYAHKSGVYRHQAKCNHRNDEADNDSESELEAEFNLLPPHIAQNERLLKIYDMMVKMKEENEELKVKVTRTEKVVTNNVTNTDNSNSHNTYNNSTINNGTVNNIYLVGYGKEDMGRIDKTDMLKVFQSGFNSALSLTETMHFNPKYPEFHNVYIPNMKNKYAMMYNGTDWNLVNKDSMIDKIYDNKRDYIEENLEDFLSSLTNSQKKALDRWLNANDDHPYINKIREDIKLLMYNKRNMVIENKRNYGTATDVKAICIDDDDVEVSNELSETKRDTIIRSNDKKRVASKTGLKRKTAKVRRR